MLKRRWAVFTPVIKMLSITSGTVLSLAAIVLLLLYLRRSVRVYNDNGKGRMKYLGRAARDTFRRRILHPDYGEA